MEVISSMMLNNLDVVDKVLDFLAVFTHAMVDEGHGNVNNWIKNNGGWVSVI